MNRAPNGLGDGPSFGANTPLNWPEAETPPQPIVVRPKDLLGFVRRWWMVVLITTMIALGFTVVSLLKATPIYVSGAQMLLGEQGLADNSSFDLIEAQAISNSVIEGELAILRSTKLLLRVVKRLELDQDPEFNPALLPPPDPTPVMDAVSGAVGAVRNRVETLLLGAEDAPPPAAPPSEPVEAAEPDAANLGPYAAPVARLRRAVSVKQQGSSFVVSVTAKSQDPRKAAAIANTMFEEYIAFLTDKRFAAAQRFTNWLEGRVTELALKWEESANDVLAFQTRIEGEADSSIRLDQQMTEMTSKLVGARAELAALEAQLSTLQSTIDEQGVIAASDLLSTDAIQVFRQDLVELRRDRTRLVQSFGESATQVQAVDRAIAATMDNIETEVERARAQMSSAAAQQTINVRALRGSLRELEARTLAGLKEQIRLDQLTRVADANRRVYEEFLGRFKETSEIKNLQRSDAEIITYASPPGAPDTPRKKVALALATVGGVFAGLALSLLLELRRRGARDAEDITRRTGLTIFAHLPTLARTITAQRLAQRLQGARSERVAMAARDVQRNIDLVSDQPAQMIVIARREGDDSGVTLAMILAWSYAKLGRSCLLVDADIRTAALSDRFAHPKEAHIVSALYGERPVEDCIIASTPLGVSLLPAVRSSADPEMIFSTNRSAEIFETIRGQKDVTIVLAPPLSRSSDVFDPSMEFDVALMHVDSRNTDRGWVRENMGYFFRTDARKRGVVLSGLGKGFALRKGN
ncbi:MAG: exopolysaccharide transport family protein [Marinibacterium sp.]|nr:exopolysaccharide transport family protein [Marinibacterium sp.]